MVADDDDFFALDSIHFGSESLSADEDDRDVRRFFFDFFFLSFFLCDFFFFSTRLMISSSTRGGELDHTPRAPNSAMRMRSSRRASNKRRSTFAVLWYERDADGG